jgi:hypothetical protein
MRMSDYANEALTLLSQGRESECRDVLNRGTVALYGLGHVEDAECLKGAIQLLRYGVEVTAHEYLVELAAKEESEND